MNPLGCKIDDLVNPKPRSRGDEPFVMAKIAIFGSKTPLTRG